MEPPSLPVIFPYLGPYFSVPELHSFAATSKAMKSACRSACLARLQSHLRPWFSDIDLFDPLMDLLGDTGVIIGGSFVVRYLLEDEEKWVPRSLDFFCPASSDRARKDLRAFIEDAGGRHHDAVLKRPSSARDCGVVGEVAYMMWQDDVCLDRVIRVFLTSGDNPLSVIPWSWSTLFANCITASSVIVAYPRTTFQRIGMTPYTGPGTLPPPAVLIRTARRGFFTRAMTIHHENDHGDALPAHYHTIALRSLSDVATFTMKWGPRPKTPRLRDVHGRYVGLRGPMITAWQYGSSDDDFCD